jgi:hypothetical protein
MAVTAKFVADFTSFQDAVTKASNTLKNVEADANKVGASLNRMVDNFSGRKLINDALLMTKAVEEVGGATALTAKEMVNVNATITEAISKYTALGQKAPQSMMDLANATKATATATDALAAGMSAAGKQSFDSSKMIAGMSAAGKEAENLSQSVSNTSKPIGALSGWFGTLGTQVLSTAAGFLSAQAVIGGVRQVFDLLSTTVRDSIKAYADAELAQTKLIAALKSQHTATPEVITQYNALASQFQRTTVFSDDLINSMQGLLVQVGDVMPSQMESALKASTDLASGLGIDLETATTLVAKAAAGHTETLGRYGITVSEAELKTKGFSAVLEAINKQFGGQASAQVETYAGQLKQAENAWNNLQEAIGKFIVSNPLVVGSIRKINEALTEGDEKTQAWSFSLTSFFGLWLSPENAAALKAAEAYADASNQIAIAWGRLGRIESPFKKIGQDFANFKFPDPGGIAFFHQLIAAEKATEEQTKKTTEARKKFTEEFGHSTEAARKLEAGFFGLQTTVKEASNSELEWIKRHQQAQTESEKLAEKIREVEQSAHIANFGFQGMADGLDKVGQKADVIPKVTKQLTGMQTVLAELPDLLIKSFTGGGGLTGALEAFSTSITKTLFSAHGAFEGFTKKISGMFGPDGIGGAIGKTLGGLLPGIGALIGPAIEGIKKLFTSAEQAINKTRAAFVDAAGGLDALRDKATAAGTTINKVLDAKNVKQYEAAVRDLNQAFEDQKAEMEDIAGFKDKFASIGGALSDSMREALRGLASIPGLSKDAADALIGMANDTKPNFAELEKKAADLGIDLAALGPIFQQAHVNDQAATLISTFEQLRDAGADVGGVINGMADEINAVVQDSIKFKTDIPENMRWMIEALIASNQLFDEQGQLITDIRDLKFGAPVKTETDKIVDAIKELGEILKKLPTIAGEAAKGMTDELANVHPPAIHVPVVFDWPNLPEGAHAATGGYVTAAGDVQYMAQGSARVLPFRPRGSDTVPAMLTPGEGVLTTAEMRALGGVAGFNTLRRNLQSGGTGSADMSGVESRLDALHQELMADRMNGPQKLARAVRDEVQKARVGRR